MVDKDDENEKIRRENYIKEVESHYSEKVKTNKDATLYAQWAPITYRINYRNVTSSDSNPNPTAYSSTETVILQNLSRSGYAFEGWYSDSSFRTPITVINSNLTGGVVTVYAKWTQLKYNIAFDL